MAEDFDEASENIAVAEEKLKEVDEKLRQDKVKATEIAKAVAASRRVRYKVDQFTQEIADSFGRLNHG